MIPKALQEIGSDDIDSLITNQVREGRTIDYKRDLPGGTDSDKKEFLADVSSFANTAGGDVVFGIDETDALPTAVVGVPRTDLDMQRRRMDSIIQNGLAQFSTSSSRQPPAPQRSDRHDTCFCLYTTRHSRSRPAF